MGEGFAVVDCGGRFSIRVYRVVLAAVALGGRLWGVSRGILGDK